MDKHTRNTPALPRRLLYAGLTAFTLVAATPLWNTAQAQTPSAASLSRHDAMQLHAEGLAMERRHDDKGAFAAFHAAAEGGYAPAQRRLGELYDHGSAAVPRSYEESIHWYRLAYENGEDIPWLGSRMPGLNIGP